MTSSRSFNISIVYFIFWFLVLWSRLFPRFLFRTYRGETGNERKRNWKRTAFFVSSLWKNGNSSEIVFLKSGNERGVFVSIGFLNYCYKRKRSRLTCLLFPAIMISIDDNRRSTYHGRIWTIFERFLAFSCVFCVSIFCMQQILSNEIGYRTWESGKVRVWRRFCVPFFAFFWFPSVSKIGNRFLA